MSGDPSDEDYGRPLVTERLRRLGGVLGVLVAGLMVAIMVPGTFFRVLAAFLTFAAILFVLWRDRRQDDREDTTYGGR